MRGKCVLGGLVLWSACLLSSTAHAYIGPGAGISAVGTLLALVGVVVLSVLGFVWYPLKRLIRGLRGGRKGQADIGDADGT